MFIVYMCTSKTSGKQYIGYTGKGLRHRLRQHYSAAQSGGGTHFYRAIRKYGWDDFYDTILWEGGDKVEAQHQERLMIEERGTFKYGYNQTSGGDGGWAVPPEKYDEWKRSLGHIGGANGRWSGFTDDEILCCAHSYFMENECNSSVSQFIEYSAEVFDMPKSYSKVRFSGYSGNGQQRFARAYCDKYDRDLSTLKYAKSEEHKLKLSRAGKGNHRKWYSNHYTKESKQFTENKQPDKWELGRKYGNTNRKA